MHHVLTICISALIPFLFTILFHQASLLRQSVLSDGGGWGAGHVSLQMYFNKCCTAGGAAAGGCLHGIAAIPSLPRDDSSGRQEEQSGVGDVRCRGHLGHQRQLSERQEAVCRFVCELFKGQWTCMIGPSMYVLTAGSSVLDMCFTAACCPSNACPSLW